MLLWSWLCGGARDGPGASGGGVGMGEVEGGGEGVQGVVFGAPAAIGHGCGGGWEVARGKMRPFFAKMSPLRTQPSFSAQC